MPRELPQCPIEAILQGDQEPSSRWTRWSWRINTLSSHYSMRKGSLAITGPMYRLAKALGYDGLEDVGCHASAGLYGSPEVTP